ncbi:autotransporter outer membrane beta-barrel domain-containing protein [Caulobacter henricii]|uniref:Autotransporter n=1 Tax=Caulobacter henricii TaxID=69395 RepID=A0A0P0P2H2_9CAUL|nr:autotransporter outer membrane beta-barrel domain-containing protein [Caulobacter henricii]ALL14715.1 autotransporter [Caulobacter henricii]
MQRKVLVATVAAAPLLALAFGAYAETSVTTARTTPIATSTANNGAADDVKVTADGSIKPTTAGALISLDSNHKVTSLGTLATVGVNDSTGILVLGGRTGSVSNGAAITLNEDYTPTDTDSDGDTDGAFATGSNRFGIRLTGAGAFTGNIVNETAGAITIEGNNSAGVSLESALIGNFTNNGTVTLLGDNSAGIKIAAPVTGKVTVNGGVSVIGKNTVGVAVDGDVSGAFVVQGGVTATGYRFTTRPSLAADRAKLDADDVLQGGSALRVTANVAGGLLLDIPPKDTDPNKTDDDGDGVVDTSEGSAALTAFGAAPALLIGSDTRTVTLGAVGTGDNAYGLVARGAISTSGVFDGISATAIQVGGNAGQATTLAGGVKLSSTVAASAYEANATGLLFKSGARAPTLWNQGSMSVFTVSEGVFDARAVAIDAGAAVTTFRNDGAITATVGGEKGSAYGVIDYSGLLTSIQNNGKISTSVVATDDAADTDDSDLLPGNEVVTGKAVAIDVSRNTTGVTLIQAGLSDGDDLSDGVADPDADGDGVDDADEPAILGAVRFGSGADTFRVLNGSVIGDIAFGAGADTFVIDNNSLVLGALTDSDGLLSITVGKGSLGISNAATINATSLTVSSTSKILFTADPTAGTNTRLQVSGAATIASGAELGIRLTGLVKQPTSYTVISAGSLTVGSIGQALLADSPYLYVASSRSDAKNVYIDVRRRSAAEIGMTRSQAGAYDAVFSALGSSSELSTVFLAQNGKDGFLGVYDQMLPDQGEGLFASLQSANQMISAATAVRPDPGERYGPDSLWIQEINSLVRRDASDTPGSDNQAFGFVAGYEAMGDAGGALGLTLAYVNVEEHDIAAKIGEQTTASFVQGGAYWRRSVGGWRLNAGGGGGFGWFTGDRRFIAPDANADGTADLLLANTADWTGATLNAFAGGAYEHKIGRYFVRPEGRVDYVWLREGERKETGGGSGFDLTVEERTSSNLSGEFGIAFGADFGQDVWWRPEVRVGYRQTLAGETGDTVARFKNGNPFTLAALDDKQGALTLGFALKAGTPMSYLALEGGAEATKKQKRYNLRLSGRAMF